MTAESATPAAGSFHEWPLVVFTTLGVTGAGLLATPLLSWAAAGTPAPATVSVRWGAALLSAGLAASLAHLGRPLRAPRASAGLGRSLLSAEVLAAGAATVVGAAAAFLPFVSPVLDLAAAAAAIVFLVTLGLVYALPGQQTWRGVVVWMPLTSGLGFGAVGLAAFWGEALAAIGAVAAVVLAADTALLVVRRLALVWPREPVAPRYPAVFARLQEILLVRFALVDIQPGLCLFAGLRWTAVALFGLGILVDRVGFYGLAAQRTTESEVGRIEGIVASHG
jgi:anaerobic dimethyl sulfoxide reductase subunit C (anchor subunit)